MSLPIIWLRMPDVNTEPKGRPKRCPHCGSYILQRWGRITKPIRDTHELQVEIHRYRCTECGRTFRAYPEGVDRSERSLRLRRLAAVTWALGLSLEEVVRVFETFGVNLSRTTIWRDGQEIVERMPQGRKTRQVRTLSAGDKNMWIDKHQGGVVLVLELKRRKQVLLEMLNESDASVVHDWLGPILRDMGLDIDVF